MERVSTRTGSRIVIGADTTEVQGFASTLWEKLEGFDSVIKDAQHIAGYLATLTVMLQFIWQDLRSIRAHQGSVLVRVFFVVTYLLWHFFLGENSEHIPLMQTWTEREDLCRRAVVSWKLGVTTCFLCVRARQADSQLRHLSKMPSGGQNNPGVVSHFSSPTSLWYCLCYCKVPA